MSVRETLLSALEDPDLQEALADALADQASHPGWPEQLEFLSDLGGELLLLAGRLEVAGKILGDHPERLVNPALLIEFISDEHGRLSKIEQALRERFSFHKGVH